jgi:4-diphosphocytidyl-2-C-methyl-D-erythritol kinase
MTPERYCFFVGQVASQASAAVTVRVPAKINLQLAVGPLGEDGYHPLVTVFHAISLFDTITVRQADRTKVTVAGDGAAAVPLGHTNLAVRAARVLAKVVGRRGAGQASVHIEIGKRIPVAAGLAGGSANAAATLVACNELWGAGLSQAELGAVGAELGSDVPFALAGGTAVGRGRGEQLSPALAVGSYHWALAFAGQGLSTPEVYAAFDRLPVAAAGSEAGPQLSADLMSALRSGDPVRIGPTLSNDLQAAALSLRPGLRRTLAAGLELGALGAIVSGSGPTCAFLASDAAHASEIAVGLTSAGVCRSVARAHGPVPGALIMPTGR